MWSGKKVWQVGNWLSEKFCSEMKSWAAITKMCYPKGQIISQKWEWCLNTPEGLSALVNSHAIWFNFKSICQLWTKNLAGTNIELNLSSYSQTILLSVFPLLVSGSHRWPFPHSRSFKNVPVLPLQNVHLDYPLPTD